jgi:signal peptidase
MNEKSRKFYKYKCKINKVFSILFIAFVLFILLLFFLNFAGKARYFVVLTDSMSPVIKPDSLVYTKTTNFNELQEGDIISFYADINLDGKKEVILHYFDSYETIKNDIYIRTKRYNTINLDSWKISENDFIGTYIFSIPYAGKFIRYFSSFIGVVNIFTGIIILFIMSILLNESDKNALPLKRINNIDG